MSCYIKPDLLLVDEIGYLPVEKIGADLLFQAQVAAAGFVVYSFG